VQADTGWLLYSLSHVFLIQGPHYRRSQSVVTSLHAACATHKAHTTYRRGYNALRLIGSLFAGLSVVYAPHTVATRGVIVNTDENFQMPRFI
jgi:hypothetical protein